MEQTIWERLGIPPTMDKKAIKKAYALQCQNCHPEEHPEEFNLLHQAYQRAMDYAASNKKEIKPKPAPDVSEPLSPPLPPISAQVNAAAEIKITAPKAHPNIPVNQETVAAMVEQGIQKEKENIQELLLKIKERNNLCGQTSHTQISDPEIEIEMVYWDELADSQLFIKYGHSDYFFTLLFDWLEEYKGRLPVFTVAGIYRLYDLSSRKARKNPQLNRLNDELSYYWKIYGSHIITSRRRSKPAADPPKETETFRERTDNSQSKWHIIWKLVVILIIIYKLFLR